VVRSAVIDRGSTLRNANFYNHELDSRRHVVVRGQSRTRAFPDPARMPTAAHCSATDARADYRVEQELLADLNSSTRGKRGFCSRSRRPAVDHPDDTAATSFEIPMFAPSATSANSSRLRGCSPGDVLACGDRRQTRS